MTQPTKLVVGPWQHVNPSERTRTLRYGSKAHGYEVIGSETNYARGYLATITTVTGVKEPKALPMDSGHGKHSYSAHAWFIQTAKKIVQEVA